MPSVKQSSFAAGEIAPSLYGRADLPKYAQGLATCLNWWVRKDGTIENRPGTEHCGSVKTATSATRMLRFVFNADQTYTLEFGDSYLRFWQNGVLVTFSGIGREWDSATTYHQGEVVADSTLLADDGIGFVCVADSSTNEIPHSNTGDGKSWRRLPWDAALSYSTGDLITYSGGFYVAIADSVNQDPTLTTGYWYELPQDALQSGIIELPTPYTADELFSLRYVQSADVVTITHHNHAPMELARLGANEWSLTAIATAPKVTPPTAIALAGSPGSVLLDYAVTAIDLDTSAESICGTASTATGGATPTVDVDQVSDVGGQFPYRMRTTLAHNLNSGEVVTPDGFASDLIYGYKQLQAINGHQFVVDVVDATHIYLRGVGRGYSRLYYTAGKLTKVSATKTLADPTTGAVTVSWTAPADVTVSEYNVYRKKNGLYGYVGTSATTSFVDDGIDPDTTQAPPTDAKLFAAADDYPAVCAYVQQRLVLANTLSQPFLVDLSRVGDYHNFTTRRVLDADDAISFSVSSDEVQAINGLADLAGKLLLFGSAGIYTVQGDANGVITPAAINLRRQSSIGSAELAPLVIDNSALYVEARGYAIHDLQYQLASDGYDGDDLSTYAQHLVDGHSIVDWCYQRQPHSIVWAVRDDGVLLGLTYVRGQKVAGWHRHDLSGGFAESVVCLPENGYDVVYLIVRRTINGSTVRYVERLHNRLVSDITADAFFVDCGATYDGRVDGRVTPTNNLRLTGGTTWNAGESLTLTELTAFGLFLSTVVGDAFVLRDMTTGESVRVTVTHLTSSVACTVVPEGVVPTGLRAGNTEWFSSCPRTISGLTHLEGQTVAVLVDGSEAAQTTVSGGKITLTRGGEVVHVGLPITADVELLDIEDPQGQTLLGRKKNVAKAVVLANYTRGLWVGPDADHLTQVKDANGDLSGSVTQPRTGPIDVLITASWNNNGRVFIRQSSPLPAQILAVVRDGAIGG